jgi:hypothetical protein
MTRSMPERTVDAWVVDVIVRTFPNALVWAPTNVRSNENWDIAASMRDGKALILENKGTEPVERSKKAPLQTHRIHIDTDQLDNYCDVVEPTSGLPVFYVLPNPPWQGNPAGAVPAEAGFRAHSLQPFYCWSWVLSCTSLRNFLGFDASSGDYDRATFCTHELPASGAITLGAFLQEVQECNYGAAFRDGEPQDPEFRRVSDEALKVGRSAIAVAIPGANLAGF